MNCLDIFTFTVQTFNQEDTVVEALESIKYQLKRYGGKYHFKYSLILIDDCSSDRTAEYALRWIQVNKKLFYSVKVTVHKENAGIVKTYKEIMKDVEGKYLKEMSGDDVLTSCDILGRCSRIKDNEIFIFPQLHIKNNRVSMAESIYYNRYFYDIQHIKHKNKMKKRFQMGILAFNSTSILFHKTLLEELGCFDYLEKFDYVEDAPVLNIMLNNYEHLDYKYFNRPVYLYRINPHSVTHIKETNHKVLHDLSVLMDDYAKNETLFWRGYFQSKKKTYLGKKCIPLHSVADRIYLLWIFLYAEVIRRRSYIQFISQIKKRVEKENMYFDYIKEESSIFLKRKYE